MDEDVGIEAPSVPILRDLYTKGQGFTDALALFS